MNIRLQVLVFYILIYNLSFGQNYIDTLLNLQKRPTDIGKYCVQTIFNDINNSSPYFQTFMKRELGLGEDGESEFTMNNGIGTVKFTYINEILFGDNLDVDAYKVYVEYKLFTMDDELFVEKLDIWGNWENVAKIFISYYPTTINIEYLKNNKTELTSYYGEDKAIFSTEFVNGRMKGKIKVRNFTGKEKNSFKNEYEIVKQEFITKKQKKEKEEADKISTFLNERKNKIYSLRDLDYSKFKNIVNDHEEILLNIDT